MRSRVAIVFHRFGPYHKVRIEAAAKLHDVLAVELSRNTEVYAWSAVELDARIERVTVSSDEDSRKKSQSFLRERLNAALDRFQPTAVAINGWSDNGALAALHWCGRNGVPAILMSESNRHDYQRSWLSEAAKRRVVAHFSAAVVGGSLARDYVGALGMPLERVFPGYDAIDNRHFAKDAAVDPAEIRIRLGLPRPYFISVCRLVAKKNLELVIEAYGKYRERAKDPFDLVLLGDGPLRERLGSVVRSRGVEQFVHFVGFRQYDEIPAYYWGAEALIHASTSEQWGLVVNEAMAAGLPVIVSDRCGCVPELVESNVNGIVFDPTNCERLTDAMVEVGDVAGRRRLMGEASGKRIRDWGPERFATAISEATAVSCNSVSSPGVLDRLALSALCWMKSPKFGGRFKYGSIAGRKVDT